MDILAPGLPPVALDIPPMSGVIVVSWPERRAVLMAKRFGRAQLIEASSGPIEAIPEAWRATAGEIRVVVEAGLLHRTIELERLSGPALEEAARYAVEPGLPLPLSEIALTLLERAAKRDPRRVAAIIPKTLLERIEAWIESGDPAPGRASVPVTWIGPFSAALRADADGIRRGATWLAEVKSGVWQTLQCVRSTTEIDELAQSREIPRDAIDKIELAELAERVAILPVTLGGGNWIRARRHAAGLLQHWPVAAAIVAGVFFAAAFGLKTAALRERARVAETAVAEAFAGALPGTRLVSPGEQLTSRLKTARAENDILRDRIIKRSSALEILPIVEEAVPADEAVIADLRITADEIVLAGSAHSMEAVQKIKQHLDAPREGSARIRTAEPSTRRSPAGLGVDFSLRGSR